MSRKPPAAPTAMWFKSIGLTPRLYGLERKRRARFNPGETGLLAALPMRIQFRPPFVVFQTRALEKWKNTRPVESRPVGAGTTQVPNGNPTSDNPPVAAAQFWKVVGGL